jgi:tetratricopeptide (TPR) repeat protein
MCVLHLKRAEQLVAYSALHELKVAIEEAEGCAARLPADRARDARLAVLRAYLTFLNAEELETSAIHEAIELFEETGDPAGAARGWWAIATVKCGCSGSVEEAGAHEAMLDCARRAGSPGLIKEALREVAGSLAFGDAPLSEALPRVRALVDELPDDARLHFRLACLEAARGRFDYARELVAAGENLMTPAERGNLWPLSAPSLIRIEWLAGNVHRTEEHARRHVSALEAEGLTPYLSSDMMFLADVLIAQDRLDEAAVLLERAAPWATADDIDALFRQARSKARYELARGNLDAAEEAARTAVHYVEETQSADEIAQTLLVLAGVLRVAGRNDEAHDVATQALAVSESRGNTVLEQRARDRLASLETAAAAPGA